MKSTAPFPSLPPRRQRGLVAVYVAIAMVALLTGVFVAVEIGRVYMNNRQMQKLASLAALDAVREVSACDRPLGRTAAQVQAALTARVNESLIRNGGASMVSGLTVRIDAGRITSEESANGGTRRVLTGLSRSGASIPVDQAEAVRVTLTGPFPGLLTGLVSRNNNPQMQVSATADRPVTGSFSVGSGLVSLDAGALNAVLSALLGGNVNLSLVDYSNGLAKVNLTVADLATALNLSVEDLSNPLTLAAQAPLLRNTLNGLANTLSSQVGPSVPALLRQLATLTTNTTAIELNRVIGSIGATSPDAPLVNLLDLLMALGQAANRGATLAVNLPLSVAGVTVNTFLTVVEPAQIGSGRPGSPEAVARTAQVRLKVRIDGGTLVSGLTTTLTTAVNSALGLLGVLGVKSTITVAPTLKLGIDVDVAQGEARLNTIQCPQAGVNNGEPIAQLSASSGVATVTVGTFTGSGASAPAISATNSLPLATVAIDATKTGLLGLVNLGSTTLTSSLGITRVGVSQTGPSPLPLDVTQFTRIEPTTAGVPVVYRADGIPPAAAVTGNPQRVGSATSASLSLGLNTSTSGSGLLGALSGLVTTLVGTLTTAVQDLLTLVNGLATSLINRLLGALGIQTGTATVVMQEITVDRPVLVSTQRPAVTP